MHADLVDRDDVRMRELRHRTRLDEQLLAIVAPEQLDRDLAIQLRVVRGVDDTEPAGAEPRAQREAPDAHRLARRAEQPRLGLGDDKTLLELVHRPLY